jgi:opacity protein-like surface antigen
LELSRGLILDVGYRYLDSGKLQTQANVVYQTVGGPFLYGGANGKLITNELQVGVRF